MRTFGTTAVVPGLIVAGLFGSFGVGMCHAAGPVGWIEDFTGPPEHYRLVRRAERIPVGLFMSLQADDEVTVLQPEGRIRLWLIDGRAVEVRGQGSARQVHETSRPVRTVTTNVLDWASGWFTRWHEESATRVVSVHVRGSDTVLGAPLLQRRETFVAVGRRPLSVVWQGGRPPYSAEIRRMEDGASVVSFERLSDGRFRTDRGLDAPGRYELRIADSEGRNLKARLTAIPIEHVPALADGLDRDMFPAPMRRTLTAAWLAAKDDGRWAFEAYQEVMLIGDEYRPAVLLRERLERGEGPSGAPE